MPFIILYVLFLFDNKIRSRQDFENLPFNLVGEIPFFESDNEETKVFSKPDDRTIIAESFRILMSNCKYFLSNSSSKVILVTSSVKGEGKTLSALNLSLAFASLDKKVLLIGADLRNPQLHKYFNEEKSIPGLVNYLIDKDFNWQSALLNKFDHFPLHKTLLSGAVPPNPLNLISNGNLDLLLKNAKNEFDYIIIDSAPTLIVSDTMSLFKSIDLALCLVRANVTHKKILNHISKLENHFENFGIILNGIGQKNSYGYSYGYKYGYGYNYSYNYGYGYGYEEDSLE